MPSLRVRRHALSLSCDEGCLFRRLHDQVLYCPLLHRASLLRVWACCKTDLCGVCCIAVFYPKLPLS